MAATDVPILFRWFPDPNVSGSGGPVPRNGWSSGYVAAYQHIHSLFVAAGATNVAFVWSVETSSGADPNLASLPGGKAVDWIAADGGTTASDKSQPSASTSEFGPWYSAFSTAGKPMMVSSTGADAGSQAAYLGQFPIAPPVATRKSRRWSIRRARSASGDQYQRTPRAPRRSNSWRRPPSSPPPVRRAPRRCRRHAVDHDRDHRDTERVGRRQ